METVKTYDTCCGKVTVRIIKPETATEAFLLRWAYLQQNKKMGQERG